MGLSAAQITEIRASYGADSSLPVRYLHAITNFLTGDLGYSVQAGVPVSQQLETNLPTTAELSALGFLGAVLLAGAVAFGASLTPMPHLRAALRALPSLFVSIPTFWLGTCSRMKATVNAAHSTRTAWPTRPTT